MARTPSTMLELGTPAADFSLLEPATGNTVSLSDFKGKPVLIAFICNHCPYVILIREKFAQLSREFMEKGVQVIAINSNDVENYPADSPEKMIEEVHTAGYIFPYLYDATQQVAQRYQAACTPDLYLFDAEHTLYYRGQFDDARPKTDHTRVTGADLKAAVDALLAGQPAPQPQKASLGCNIKWKPGNEPDYFG